MARCNDPRMPHNPCGGLLAGAGSVDRMSAPDRLRVLVCGFSDALYPRDATLVSALERSPDVEVVDARRVDDGWIRKHSGRGRRRAGRRVPVLSRSWLVPRALIALGRVDAVLVMKWNERFVLDVCRWARRSGIPVLYDIWVSRYLYAQRKGAGVERWRGVERDILAACDRVVPVTEAYRDFYAEEYGTAGGRMCVVRMGVPDLWLDQEPRGRPEDGLFVVGYWGNVHAHHGLDVALEAARRLEDVERIRFRLYGSVKLEELYPTSSVPSNVEIHPFIADQSRLVEVVDSLDAALGHLLPMHDAHLCLPNKALQGMARGKPVLHVASEEMRELDADRGGPVVLFEEGARGLAARIRELSERPDRAREIGRRARSVIECRHSVSSISEALRASLADALGGDAPSAGR